MREFWERDPDLLVGEVLLEMLDYNEIHYESCLS